VIRKTVTLVFCDVSGSTALAEALDPETVRGVMSRYFDTARTVLERHGGTVEKFVGDAVMAAFGIPTVHEDDALRAVRAAAELRDALRVLNAELKRDFGVEIAVRTGVNTGEVIAGDPALGQGFATGDAVVLTQRLESVAGPNEILLGDATYRVVREAVAVEPLPPLELKGRSAPSGAWRLLRVEAPIGVTRRLDTPFVGRADELGRLTTAFREVVAGRRCGLITVLGDAGVGKSRLVAELVDVIGDEAHVLEGRCLPYGKGITYWPVAEIVRTAAAVSPSDSAEVAREKLAALLGDDPDAAVVAARVADAAGLSESGSRSEEISWAVRRFFEILANRRPLLVVIDDVQWAEATLLDMVEYLEGWSREAPILLCCLARPDLLEMRPAWHDAAEVRLEPLPRDEAAQLVRDAFGEVDPRAVEQIVGLAEGNPLFVQEIARMLVDDESLVRQGDAWVLAHDPAGLRVPSTIQSVLSARLDRLDAGELAVLQCAAVIGLEFLWGAVTEICSDDDRPQAAGLLHSLARRRLVQPHATTLLGEDGFRFGHILVRDTTYDSIPKRRRADLHARLADWIESRVDGGLESEEILAHHLEQAYRYRVELGSVDAASRELAERASERLGVAGRRALGRGDAPAAVSLLERAVAIGRPPDASLLRDLSAAQRDTGDLESAWASLDAAHAAAATDAERSRVEVERAFLASYTDPSWSFDRLLDAARAAQSLREDDDEEGLVRALTLEAYAFFISCQVAAMEDALRRALVHAERSGDRRGVIEVLVGLARAAVVGPEPVGSAIERCCEIRSRNPGSRWLEGVVCSCLSYLEAMSARGERSRELYLESEEVLGELGRRIHLGGTHTYAGAAELLTGDPVTAEQELRRGFELLDSIHETGNLSTIAAVLAEALLAQGRVAEAVELTGLSEATASPDDVTSQVGWRCVRGRALARETDPGDAARLVAEAVAIAEETDSPNLRGSAYAANAEVLDLVGRSADAVAARARARLEYERKGNVAAVRALESLPAISPS
jgi:class 3 adenylate cyclase/tetratricopeptide (TPR) repeat protein